MPIKKLVELNGEYGGWLEIDPVKLRRVAREFRAWLLTLDANADPCGLVSADLPLADAALQGSLSLPYFENPHQRQIGEGELDWCLDKLAPFYNTIRGALDAPPEVIMKDGRCYAWTEWEDPPDDASGESNGT